VLDYLAYRLTRCQPVDKLSPLARLGLDEALDFWLLAL